MKIELDYLNFNFLKKIMASIVEKIDRLNKETREELVELLDKATKIYRGHLLKGTVEDQDRRYEYLFNLCNGYVVKNFRSNHSYKERILMLEEFVYMLSLEEVRKVAELLKVLDF